MFYIFLRKYGVLTPRLLISLSQEREGGRFKVRVRNGVKPFQCQKVSLRGRGISRSEGGRALSLFSVKKGVCETGVFQGWRESVNPFPGQKMSLIGLGVSGSGRASIL